MLNYIYILNYLNDTMLDSCSNKFSSPKILANSCLPIIARQSNQRRCLGNVLIVWRSLKFYLQVRVKKEKATHIKYMAPA